MAKLLTTLKPFEELAHTDEIIRLDWFGGVHSNLDEYDNPLLHCVFSPIIVEESDKQLLDKAELNRQFQAGIAVGYLPSLFLGQYFRKGKRLPLNEWPSAETIHFQLDQEKPEAVTECSIGQLNLQSRILTPNIYAQANGSGLKLLKGKLLKTTHKTKKVNVEESVVIHELELIRYYLTNSSHSCKNIFSNAFTEEELALRVVNRIHEQERFDPLTGEARLVYRHKYTQEDAPILGRILFEPEGLGLAAARRVSSSISANRVNTSWNVGYPRTYFPFKGSTKLVLTGRRLRTKEGYVFLAYRIISCDSLFPFKNLSYCDEIQPGGESAPAGAPAAFPDSNPISGPSAPEGGESQSTQQPKSNSLTDHVELSQREYPGLKNVEMKNEKLRKNTHTSTHKTPNADDSLIHGSTGATTSGASSARSQSVHEKINVPTLSADLEVFVEALQGLRTLHPDWKIQTRLLKDGFEMNGEWISYFPQVPCRKRKHINRQFSYLDESKHERKTFICAELQIDQKFVYLFEAQRRSRKNGAGITEYIDPLPVLVIRDVGFIQLIENDLFDFVWKTVVNKTWPSNYPGWTRDHTLHGHGVTTVEQLAARVDKLLLNNL